MSISLFVKNKTFYRKEEKKNESRQVVFFNEITYSSRFNVYHALSYFLWDFKAQFRNRT